MFQMARKYHWVFSVLIWLLWWLLVSQEAQIAAICGRISMDGQLVPWFRQYLRTPKTSTVSVFQQLAHARQVTEEKTQISTTAVITNQLLMLQFQTHLSLRQAMLTTVSIPSSELRQEASATAEPTEETRIPLFGGTSKMAKPTEARRTSRLMTTLMCGSLHQHTETRKHPLSNWRTE